MPNNRLIEQLAIQAESIARAANAPSVAVFHLLAAFIELKDGEQALTRVDYDIATIKVGLVSNDVAVTVLAQGNDEQGRSLKFKDSALELIEGATDRVTLGADEVSALCAAFCSETNPCRVTRAILERARTTKHASEDSSPDLSAFRQRLTTAKPRVKAERKKDSGKGATPSRPAKPALEEIAGQGGRNADAYVRNALVDIKEKARKGELSSVVVDESNINLLMETVSKSRAPNALLIGSAGTGKTTLVEALALKLHGLPKANALSRRPILSIEVSTLLAGTRFRGDFEERISALVDIATKENAILFIDEIHTLAGAGASGGEAGLDAINILKPALARGEFSLVGATTPQEALLLKKDAAFMRRFEEILITPPKGEALKGILADGSQGILKHHKISMDQATVEAAISLLDRYAPHLGMPAAGFELIDRASARASLAGKRKLRQEHLRSVLEDMTGAVVGRVDEEISHLHEIEDIKGLITNKSAMTLQKGMSLASIGLGNTQARTAIGIEGKKETVGSFAAAVGSALDLPVSNIDMGAHKGPSGIHRYFGSDTSLPDGELVQVFSARQKVVLHLTGLEEADTGILEKLSSDIRRGWVETTSGRRFSMRGAVIVVSIEKKAPTQSIGFGVNQTSVDTSMPSAVSDFLDVFLSSDEGAANAALLVEFNTMNEACEARGLPSLPQQEIMLGLEDADLPKAISTMRSRVSEFLTS